MNIQAVIESITTILQIHLNENISSLPLCTQHKIFL